MTIFIYYSPSNKEVIAIVANNYIEAAERLNYQVKDQIIKDDYYLATSVKPIIGDCGAIDIQAFDSLKQTI